MDYVRLVLLAVALLATCVTVQSLGMLVLIRWLSRVRRILESRSTYLRVALLLRLFVGIVLLHLVQVGLWAVVFWRAGAAERGHGALLLPRHLHHDRIRRRRRRAWVAGAGRDRRPHLLVGWSTAFVFA